LPWRGEHQVAHQNVDTVSPIQIENPLYSISRVSVVRERLTDFLFLLFDLASASVVRLSALAYIALWLRSMRPPYIVAAYVLAPRGGVQILFDSRIPRRHHLPAD
jgi:hypothetical protein